MIMVVIRYESKMEKPTPSQWLSHVVLILHDGRLFLVQKNKNRNKHDKQTEKQDQTIQRQPLRRRNYTTGTENQPCQQQNLFKVNVKLTYFPEQHEHIPSGQFAYLFQPHMGKRLNYKSRKVKDGTRSCGFTFLFP